MATTKQQVIQAILAYSKDQAASYEQPLTQIALERVPADQIKAGVPAVVKTQTEAVRWVINNAKQTPDPRKVVAVYDVKNTLPTWHTTFTEFVVVQYEGGDFVPYVWYRLPSSSPTAYRMVL